MFYLVGIFKTSSLGNSISCNPGNPERTALRGWGQESGYRGVCNKGQVVWTSEVYFVNFHQVSQVKRFSAFLCMGRCKSLGLLKSFLSYASQLSGMSQLSDITIWYPPVSYAFPVLSSSVLTWIPPHREWLQPHGWVTAGIVLLPECPGWAGTVMTVTSLFIDMAGILHVSAASFCSLKSSYLTLRRAFWTERTLYT